MDKRVNAIAEVLTSVKDWPNIPHGRQYAEALAVVAWIDKQTEAK